MKTIIFSAAICCVFLLFILFRHKRNLAIARNDRKGDSIEGFAHAFRHHKDGEDVAKEIYRLIQEEFLRNEFPIRHRDDIERDLGIAVEDFDELMGKSLARFDIPISDAIEYRRGQPIKTIDELVSLILALKASKHFTESS